MALRDRLEVVIDFVTGPARAGLAQLRGDAAGVEANLGRSRAAAGQLAGTLRANAVPAAMAASAALFEFGRRSVNAFTEGALAAGKFADATGTSAEEASRLVEVFDLFGVEANTLETAIGRMNRAAAATPEAFSAIGAEIERTANGGIDTLETFLGVVDALNRMPDAAARAEAAQLIFGRGWQQIAESVALGSESLRRELAAVSDEQVFDDDEVRKARAYRSGMDDLRDQFTRLQNVVGEGLAPALTDAAALLTDLVSLAEQLSRVDPFAKLTGGEVTLFTGSLSAAWAAARKLFGLEGIDGRLAPGLDLAGQKASDLGDELDDVRTAYETLVAATDPELTYLAILDQLDEVQRKGLEAWNAAATGAADADAKVRDYRRSQILLERDVARYAEQLGDLPPEVVTELAAMVDEQRYYQVERKLEALEADRRTDVDVFADTGTAARDLDTFIGTGRRLPVWLEVRGLDTLGRGVTNIVNQYLPAGVTGGDMARAADEWIGRNGARG